VNNGEIGDKLKIETNLANESYDNIDYGFFTAIDSLTKKEAKQVFTKLKHLYSINPNLTIDSSKCSIPLHLIKTNDFRKLFTKNIDKGSDKFYNVYLRSIGAFRFTKVIYSGDLVVLLVDFNDTDLRQVESCHN
jgi:hypothetical protein